MLPAVVGIDAHFRESGINGFGCSIVELVRTFTRSLIIESVSAIGVLENGCCEFGFGIPCERIAMISLQLLGMSQTFLAENEKI